MPLRQSLLFAMFFTIVALAVSGILHDKARFAAPTPDTSLRAPLPAAHVPHRRLRSSPGSGAFLPASLVPIQLKNSKDLGVGKLLVASRGLPDPNFAESVVLLVHYDEQGVVGLILNRRTDLPLSQVLDLKAAKERTDPVYLGGPVEHSAVFALFQSTAKIEKAENIFGGVYLISDKSLFEKTLSSHPDPSVFHVFLGYAGWTPDQLQAEIKSGAWFVFPADAAAVFNTHPDSLWLQMIRQTEMKWARTGPFAEISRPAESPL
jgi:putative AlgH/UPF0301 family transcriptional regulator